MQGAGYVGVVIKLRLSDYTYIDDIIQGAVAALKYDGAMWDIFNLGENETVQLKDLIEAIEAAVGRKAKINRLPEQAG